MKFLPKKVAATVAAVFLGGALLAACQSTVVNKEDMLAAAGFTPRPANTPERLKALTSLPAHKFSQINKNGTTTYVYPDPTVCNCLYVGNQSDFQSYQQMMYQQHLANEQTMAAMINQDIMWDNTWDWGPWGGVGWW
ncbi:hypothetical protein SAMN02745172_01517 [Pseudoxanthobacter soli DSM 19599]|uniref:SmpA / OmlA family protein n=1 Tax=Pseudoxanthobacter soli DSM 19599 TaxID=1123029 RepID=A0A1M7ZFQ8_9HYPH|nr:hypothetical protein [Pseudoxanthobacter soli]SHO63649.1 hypothetical protein SAMN02745172_01517 [Pseudoxanthobacter soli DSM 19599]